MQENYEDHRPLISIWFVLKKTLQKLFRNQNKTRLFGPAIYNKFNSNFILFFWNSISLCSIVGCPGTHYEDQTGLISQISACHWLPSPKIKDMHQHRRQQQILNFKWGERCYCFLQFKYFPLMCVHVCVGACVYLHVWVCICVCIPRYTREVRAQLEEVGYLLPPGGS